jgi:hypothetical protein
LPRKSTKTRGVGKRYPLNMRTTKEVRVLLERAAARSGRSLVQEVEHRIDSSFRDDMLFKAIGGTQAHLIIRPILYFLGTVEPKSSAWKNDPAVANAMRQAISLIAEAIFAGHRLSKDRQAEFLNPFFLARGIQERIGRNLDDPAAGIAIDAVAVLQAFGLAEKFQTQSVRSAESQSEGEAGQ